jgi:hypothetical protein
MTEPTPEQIPNAESPIELEGGTYEIIRNRLASQGKDMRSRLAQLNEARRSVFGAIETKLIETARITTEHNCVPRDMTVVGRKLLFGYNIHFGLKTETHLNLHFNRFTRKLQQYDRDVVPRFRRYVALKKEIVDAAREEMRLEEFRPRVLTSFVRNKLIDSIYLPLIGDNLAKQIGVVGEQKRTDLMGLLLLVSPPGYGKTTLMEYLANRLGIIFMKINGPALGHHITSLDPT